MAKKAGVRLSIQKVESSFIKDYVAEQSLEAGDDAPKGCALTLTISAGRTGIDDTKQIKMPSLAGKTLEEALKAAEEGDFYIGIEKQEHSSEVKKGSVIRQSVKEGSEISGGEEVLLVISSGPEQMKVPDVVGKPLEEAKETLEKQKLEYVISEKNSSDYDKGIVMEQSVEAGKTVDEGTKIELVVSKGK